MNAENHEKSQANPPIENGRCVSRFSSTFSDVRLLKRPSVSGSERSRLSERWRSASDTQPSISGGSCSSRFLEASKNISCFNSPMTCEKIHAAWSYYTKWEARAKACALTGGRNVSLLVSHHSSSKLLSEPMTSGSSVKSLLPTSSRSRQTRRESDLGSVFKWFSRTSRIRRRVNLRINIRDIDQKVVHFNPCIMFQTCRSCRASSPGMCHWDTTPSSSKVEWSLQEVCDGKNVRKRLFENYRRLPHINVNTTDGKQ